LAAREAACARDLRGWLYSGMCGRIALDLGLHLDVSNLVTKGILTEEDRYVRSRTFWGVFVFDKEYSAIIGRPSAIRNMVITCAKPGPWPGEDYVSTSALFHLTVGYLLTDPCLIPQDWHASAKQNYIVPLPPGAPASAGTMFVAGLAIDVGEIYDQSVHQMYFRPGPYRHSIRKEQLASLDRNTAHTRKAMAGLPPLVVRDENAKDPASREDESKVLPGLIII